MDINDARERLRRLVVFWIRGLASRVELERLLYISPAPCGLVQVQVQPRALKTGVPRARSIRIFFFDELECPGAVHPVRAIFPLLFGFFEFRQALNSERIISFTPP